MVEGIDSGALRPHDKDLYLKEYKHGADLFQRALDEHAKSTNPYQKEEFKEVMDKAMNVLNETARELKRKDLMKKNQKIEEDYQLYQSSPNSKTQNTLNGDLGEAKNLP